MPVSILAKPLSSEQFADLNRALIKYLVIFFGDQKLDIESLKAVSRRFGDLHVPPALAHLRVPGHPEVINFRIDENSAKAPGEVWHSDMSCDPEPPLGSILYLHTVPEVGGDTAFANMYAAYDELSDRMKQYLEGLTAIHDAAERHDEVPTNVTLPRSSHPVIRTHPVSKRKAIYVNENFTRRIEGLSRSESNMVLQYLYRQHSRAGVSMSLPLAPELSRVLG